MDRIEELVDAVMAAFRARHRKNWSLTELLPTGTGQELGPWRERIAARLKCFPQSIVDRSELMARTRRRLRASGAASADFAGVADELQEMAREDLRDYLRDNGMPEEAARKVAHAYSIGALLHDR